GAGGRVVVDVDVGGEAGRLDGAGDVEQPGVVAAERRVDLDRDDPAAGAEIAAELRLLARAGDGRHGELALRDVEALGRPSLLVDRRPDRRDLIRRRPAAAADQACAEAA